MIVTDARAKRSRLLMGLLGLTLGSCSAMEGRSGAGNASGNENVGEVALAADSQYTGTCPAGSVFELTADGQPGCRTNFSVCVDLDVVSTGAWLSPWPPYSGPFYSGPKTVNIGRWGALPTLTQTEILIDCSACGSSWGNPPPTSCASEWGYVGDEGRPAIYSGVDQSGQPKTVSIATYASAIGSPNAPGVIMVRGNASSCGAYYHGSSTATESAVRWCTGPEPL